MSIYPHTFFGKLNKPVAFRSKIPALPPALKEGKTLNLIISAALFLTQSKVTEKNYISIFSIYFKNILHRIALEYWCLAVTLPRVGLWAAVVRGDFLEKDLRGRWNWPHWWRPRWDESREEEQILQQKAPRIQKLMPGFKRELSSAWLKEREKDCSCFWTCLSAKGQAGNKIGYFPGLSLHVGKNFSLSPKS